MKEEKEVSRKEILRMMERCKACCRNCQHPACINKGRDTDHYCGNYMDYYRGRK